MGMQHMAHDLYTEVLRSAFPCSHKGVTVFRGALKVSARVEIKYDGEK